MLVQQLESNRIHDQSVKETALFEDMSAKRKCKCCSERFIALPQRILKTVWRRGH